MQVICQKCSTEGSVELPEDFNGPWRWECGACGNPHNMGEAQEMPSEDGMVNDSDQANSK